MIARRFTQPDKLVLENLKYSKFYSVIKDAKGEIVFEQKEVEAPYHFSQRAVDVLASKYFKKGIEKSYKQVVGRVLGALKAGAISQGYLNESQADVFSEELAYCLAHQKVAFNSPVWFNLGVSHYGLKSSGPLFRVNPTSLKVESFSDAYQYPQTSACFIQSIDDNLNSIYELLANEGKLFKFGSGSGTNFSKLRSAQDHTQHGVTSSGLMSFLEVFDKAAQAIKSGGTTRRAAKMVCLDADHPEIFDFIRWKEREEKKAQALIAAGYGSGFEEEAYRTVSGQHSNNSVRVSDNFMKALLSDSAFDLKSPLDRSVVKSVPAHEIWDAISQAAWVSSDPGVQFDTTINRWHTCPKRGPIRASNPCSEFMFLDDSACNLASIKLTAFLSEDGKFLWDDFRHVCRLMILAQEILVSISGFPTAKIAENSFRFRPLGIGFADLGSLLMLKSIPYGSDEACVLAAEIASFMSAVSYGMSAELAQNAGSIESDSMEKVLGLHLQAAKDTKLDSTREWEATIKNYDKWGIRNAQISVVAPTGTIGLLMDCETMGIEPEYSLLKTKKLAGGGTMIMKNSIVERALKKMGATNEILEKVNTSIEQTGELSTKLGLDDRTLALFKCASDLSPREHLKMVAAVQPFISGAISKTINLPNHITPKQIGDIHIEAWKLGLKSVSIYRDGSKQSQPLNRSVKCQECGDTQVVGPGCSRCLNCGYAMGCE